MNSDKMIVVLNAREHNLKSVSLNLPRNKFIVVTGVSGSGKSSLVFDVLYREAESRYLGSFSSAARQFMGKIRQPDVEQITGIAPAIALDQKRNSGNPRSTVGTITGIYDLLRLLFARTGQSSTSYPQLRISRSLFSFNTQEGACPACKGLGVEDFLDPDLIVADENRSLRQGALVITAPNGYIIYSQVTLDVLDQVCRAEGFNIDIPWKELTPGQKNIIWYGSNKIEIPFGKHPLESRMKWSGITAKPREMGYYKGILTIMEEILRRDRNRNILRFVRSVPCHACGGMRLNPEALSITIGGFHIAALSSIPVEELPGILENLPFPQDKRAIANPVLERIGQISTVLSRLSLGYLNCNRGSESLPGGEMQRMQLATISLMDLSGMIFVFDEPSVGLHPRDTFELIRLLREIRDRGNTVIAVEHDEVFMRHADWLTDIGPGPGVHGGEVLFNGPVSTIPDLPEETILRSRTLTFLLGREKGNLDFPQVQPPGAEYLTIQGACANNLKNLDVSFRLHEINVVCGVSGAGKSSLVDQTLAAFFRHALEEMPLQKNFGKIEGFESIRKLVTVDQSPIGRTPRSNPATYTGLFDLIRDLFARQPLAMELGFDKSRFSFNTPGGRCEICQGAGYRTLGMHFMGNVEVVCENCEGKRFDDETLRVEYLDRNITQILEMTVEEAHAHFAGQQAILGYLDTLQRLGLGYLTLGQRSSTLSGGEAQRIRLAAELSRPQSTHTLYILDEPSTGLHRSDVRYLTGALQDLVRLGHTVVITDHHPDLLMTAGHILEIGHGSGKQGGQLVFSGSPQGFLTFNDSPTSTAIRGVMPNMISKNSNFPSAGNQPASAEPKSAPEVISITSASVNNLRNISVTIPKNKITAITGISGSGKSSLAFDTIHAEAVNRFLDGFSPYIRTRIGMQEEVRVGSITGLTPTLASVQTPAKHSPRSTVGTVTGIHDFLRLLYARAAGPSVNSTTFSFNHQAGACPQCNGLGEKIFCDPLKLITSPHLSILGGAMDGTKTGKFYGDPDGQYTAMIRAVAMEYGFDPAIPWEELPAGARDVVLYGAGDSVFEAVWAYRRGEHTGEHRFRGAWKGLARLVEEEYERKHADHRGESMMNVMSSGLCSACKGKRLRPEALEILLGSLDIAALASMQLTDALPFMASVSGVFEDSLLREAAEKIARQVSKRMQVLIDLGLGYLSLSRPMTTLSGGETRRVTLASRLHSGLSGITFILDEPSAGLHPRDSVRLSKHIHALKEAGNTVVMVEHSTALIRSADHIIDLGPGAGSNGGSVVAEGTPEQIMQNPCSLTGQYLRNDPEAGIAPVVTSGDCQAEKPENEAGISIRSAFANNLKHFDLTLPATGIIAGTGLSGTGKSSLVEDVIFKSWQNHRPEGCSSISGFEHYSHVIRVSQVTGVYGGNSLVATYTGLSELVRDLFAATHDARQLGLVKNHFSLLNRQAQCSSCLGEGSVRTSMDFLPDVVNTCEACHGSGFTENVLKVKIEGRNIADVMEMTVTEAAEFFRMNVKIKKILDLLAMTGLGYLKIGQPLSTLSGGEMQRLQLAAGLIKPVTGASLYLFDEPATGLHPHDISHLAGLMKGLASQGHCLVVIDHHPAMVSCASFLIELGPEGGDQGGYLISASYC